MIRRGIVSGILCLLLAGGIARAAVPDGPRLAVVSLHLRGVTELFTVGVLGGERSTVYAASAKRVPAVYPFSPPSWSPDGTRIAFTALTGQHQGRYASFPLTMIATVSVDGGEVEPVPGTADGSGPIFSPDGQHIAFTRERKRRRPNDHGGANTVYESASIWLADLAGGVTRQLTPWRNHLYKVASSFSPDGSRLAFTRIEGDRPPEAVEMALSDSAESVLARHAIEPAYSPDGAHIAFLRGPVKTEVRRSSGRNSSEVSRTTARMTDLYVRDPDGLVHRLTATKRLSEFGPRWDPSGQRLAYAELDPFGSETSFLGFGDSVMEINADGTCATQVLSQRRSTLYGATWQPGPGREAGSIVC